MGLELGHLLRLKGQVDAATQTTPDGFAASALVESYNTCRDQIVGALEEGDLLEEFAASFPELPAAVEPESNFPYNVNKAAQANKGLAQRAQVSLARLAGWLDGLIAEQTLEQRMRIEAQETAKLARRQPPGF